MTQRTALIISECQRGIIDEELTLVPTLAQEVRRRGIIGSIARTADAFREAGLPVVHCLIEYRPDMAGVQDNTVLGKQVLRTRRMIRGTEDVRTPAEIAPVEGDFVSSRAGGLTAFYGTDLDVTLRRQGVETLVLAGVSTDVAIFGLAAGAVDRGYRVQIIEDAVAGSSPEAFDFMMSGTLRMLARITDSEKVIASLK